MQVTSAKLNGNFSPSRSFMGLAQAKPITKVEIYCNKAKRKSCTVFVGVVFNLAFKFTTGITLAITCLVKRSKVIFNHFINVEAFTF